MAGREISDRQLESIKAGLVARGVHETKNLKNIIKGIYWKLKTGAQWRDVPERYGPWSSIYNQFNRWSKNGLIDSLFKSEITDPDNEWNCMDGTIVKAHQDAAGARKGEETAIGKSCAGSSTKIHMLCDALGNPLHFEITEGQMHDIQKADDLLKESDGEKIITDKGYTSSEFTANIKANGKDHVIPVKKTLGSKTQISIQIYTKPGT
jgi:transposase